MAMTAKERGALGAQKRWGKSAEDEPQERTGPMPKYRITALCYMNDRLYDPEAMPRDDDGELKPLIVEVDGQPAWYMEPVNDAAREQILRTPPAVFASMEPLINPPQKAA